jgi:hypothetical protein
MAWYNSHEVRFHGRLVEVSTRYGCFNGARVLRGKPLNLSFDLRSENPEDSVRLEKLFYKKKARGDFAEEIGPIVDDGGW